ncbi:hypothetical protein EKO04_008392 [Ascochyta lentis]|uniref:Uncharacterized protein n=1 Tax=Ascochyta lentis TaxID=205686 RepID=A0A8H7MGG5_9PLEO|nr:hypothetical protein EKO04_008392 [Ascochyta lentis]
MHKSIELGRAVLSTSTTNHELWLKTLITISPQQQCTNIEQYDTASLLDYLSSGEAWVGRGNGLYIKFDFTFRGEPLADEQIRQLSKVILDAPVWSQLGLQPTLPHSITHEPGKLRIMINHASERAVSAVKQHHRILSNISAADIQPPEGIPVFLLDSVLLSMDVFETVQRGRVTTAKRLKTLTYTNNPSPPATSQAFEDVAQGAFGTRLLDMKDTVSAPESSPATKRTRSPTSSPVRTAPFVGRLYRDCQLTARNCDSQDEISNTRSNVGIADLQTLVDRALRLSVTGSINSKSVPGTKVKANTFGPGLAEVAPTLWRPGYLLSLSQRANLLQVISRSLCQPATTGKIASMSLKKKLSAMMAPSSSFQAADQATNRGPVSTSDTAFLTSSIASLLWLHLQKNIPGKSATPLRSFVTIEPLPTTLAQSDDILEQVWQSNGHDSRLSAVGLDGSGAFGISPALNDHPVYPAACCGTPSEEHFLRALGGTKAVPENADDELLLGDPHCP